MRYSKFCLGGLPGLINVPARVGAYLSPTSLGVLLFDGDGDAEFSLVNVNLNRVLNNGGD